MLRAIVVFLILVLFAAPIGLAVAAFQSEPLLTEAAQLSPQQAAEARNVARRIRNTTRGQDGSASLSASSAEIEALLATGGRVLQPLRGRTEIDAAGLWVVVSAQLPRLARLGWVNLSIAVAPSSAGIELHAVRLGRLDLPPGPTLAALRLALDAITSEDIGSRLIGAVETVQTAPGLLTLTFDTGGLGDDSLFSQTMDGLREAVGLGDVSRAAADYAAMARAAHDGALPGAGSVAPWLAFTANRVAAAEADGADRNAARRAALLALAAHCGDRRVVVTIAGDITGGGTEASACEGTRLAERTDLRKHFILSAALQATGGSVASFGLGEIKELVDSGSGGSGFSFDDVAADRAGIRFAEVLAVASPQQLAALAAGQEEGAFMPAIVGLPSGLTDAEFAARYRSVDSPAYAAQIDAIDARIDALSAYAD
ncbi:hypothetical protein [Pseudoruegeria sp. SK021]|uniref:hypothetical protein n=1 Tax=Pseudoruegeria sp. SK021 TaxID=1933035 RepID=UPI000A237A92|nr:hypothetical protein [Pseudoruegeria sp. SK021]OSP53600.1 hypothetical protein BV911_17065 [Pseudoruegeria sp. SK021]